MTLVTTCPNCETSFRVVADQLKLRRGLVRCGQCRTVFSGLERLRRLEEETGAPTSASGAPPPSTAAPSEVTPATGTEAGPDSGPLPSFGAPASEAAVPSFGDAGQIDDDSGPEDYAPWRSAHGHPEREDDLDGADWRTKRFDDDASPMTLAVDSPDTLPIEDETLAREETHARDEALAPDDTLPAGEALPHDDTLPHDEALPRREADEASRSEWPDIAPSNLFRTPPARRAAGYGDPPTAPAAVRAQPLAPEPTPEPAPARRPAREPAAPHDEDQRFAEELEAVAQELEAWDDSESAIDYFSAERRRRGFIGRNGGWKLLGAAALVLLLGLQATFASRDWLAARFPALEPMIATLGAPFGLEIRLPRALESLAIESFELQAAGRPGLFSVSAIVRNDATYAVRWPSMLLTLTDPANRVLLRKAIDPADYLPPAAVEAGLRPRSERPIRLALEADEVQPAGYSVTLFYR